MHGRPVGVCLSHKHNEFGILKLCDCLKAQTSTWRENPTDPEDSLFSFDPTEIHKHHCCLGPSASAGSATGQNSRCAMQGTSQAPAPEQTGLCHPKCWQLPLHSPPPSVHLGYSHQESHATMDNGQKARTVGTNDHSSILTEKLIVLYKLPTASLGHTCWPVCTPYVEHAAPP